VVNYLGILSGASWLIISVFCGRLVANYLGYFVRRLMVNYFGIMSGASWFIISVFCRVSWLIISVFRQASHG